jgi:hypothetical protein
MFDSVGIVAVRWCQENYEHFGLQSVAENANTFDLGKNFEGRARIAHALPGRVDNIKPCLTSMSQGRNY